MKQHESFAYSLYEEQTHDAELELFSYVKAVSDMFGEEQARFARNDWLEEADLIDMAPCSTNRDWRSVTIAASARFLNRLCSAQQDWAALLPSPDTKVSTIPSSNSLASVLLV